MNNNIIGSRLLGWSKNESAYQVEFSLKKLKSGHGYLSNKPVVYNATTDTVIVDTNKLAEIPDLAAHLEQKVRSRFIDSILPVLRELISDFDNKIIRPATILKAPFKVGDFTFLQSLPEQERFASAHKYVLYQVGSSYTDLIDKDGTKRQYSVKKATASSINIKETFNGFSNEELIPYLLYLSQRIGYQFSGDGRAIDKQKADGFSSFDSIKDTPMVSLLSHLSLHCPSEFNLEFDVADLFENEYFSLGEGRRARSKFSSIIERLWMGLKEILFELADDKIIILPFKFDKCNLPGNLIDLLDVHPLKIQLWELSLRSEPDRHKKRYFKDFTTSICLSSTMSSMSDLPERLAVNVSDAIKAERQYNTSVGLPFETMRRVFDELETTSSWQSQTDYKAFNRSFITPTSLKRITNMNTARKSLDLAWAKGLVNPSFYNQLITYTQVKCNKSTINQVNNFVDWLISLPAPYCGYSCATEFTPEMFHDPVGKFGPQTFKQYIEEHVKSETSKKAIFSRINALFRFLLDKKSVETQKRHLNPAPHAKDITASSPMPSKTTRQAMPSIIHEMAVSILKKNDYQFAKENLPRSHIKLLNQKTRQLDQVFSYNVAHILHILLLIPIRLHQARWLDEGLLDAKIWSIDEAKYVKNTHPLSKFTYSDGKRHSIKYGNTGVLFSSHESDNSSVNLYINTNKTKGYSLQKKGYTGYTIPWPYECEVENIVEVYNILEKQRAFNAVYSPINLTPVKTVEESADKYTAEIWEQLPYFTPLFRDLSASRVSAIDSDRTNLFLPTRDDNVRNLFRLLLKETEKQYKEAYPQYKDQRVLFDGDDCLFDVHSLRVFGITELLGQGLDEDIVRQLVGHNTVIMTMYYKKLSEDRYRQLLLESKKKAGVATKNELDLLQFGLRDGEVLLNNFETMLSEDRDKFPVPDFEMGGKPKIVKGGVCSSFDCETGGVSIMYSKGKEVVEVTPVEGGSMRCGNCRYWRTGPRFLLEQIYYLNEVASEIEELANKRSHFLSQSNAAYDNKDIELPEVIATKYAEKADEVSLLLACRLTELKRRRIMLDKTMESSNLELINKNLPAVIETVDVHECNWESLNMFDAAMERTTQAAVLGLVGEEDTISMVKLEKFCTQLASLSEQKNPLLFMPNDEVKRAAMLYKLSSITEQLGRTFDDDEFSDPRVLLEHIGADKFMELGQSLTSLESTLLTDENA